MSYMVAADVRLIMKPASGFQSAQFREVEYGAIAAVETEVVGPL